MDEEAVFWIVTDDLARAFSLFPDGDEPWTDEEGVAHQRARPFHAKRNFRDVRKALGLRPGQPRRFRIVPVEEEP
jgi:hypothetical protein